MSRVSDRLKIREAYGHARTFAVQAQQQIQKLLRSAIRSLGDPNLVRCRVESRIKGLASVERRARERGWNPAEAAFKVNDLVGFRLICNNLQDVERAAEMVTQAFRGQGLPVRALDYLRRPKPDGYRSVHLYVRWSPNGVAAAAEIECEIQIRSLLQNAWGELSRSDLYKSGIPAPTGLKQAMKRLADKLAEADRMADPIRTQLSLPRRGLAPKGGRPLGPEALARLYKQAFGHEPPEFLVAATLQGIKRADVRQDVLLAAMRSKRKLKRIRSVYKRHLGLEPEPHEVFRWVVRWVAKGESPLKQAKRAAASVLQESDAYVMSQVAAELPEDWRDIVSMIDNSGKDGVEEDIHRWAAAFGGASEDFWTLEPAVYADSLAMALADHYRLRGSKYDEAVGALTDAIVRSGVLLA